MQFFGTEKVVTNSRLVQIPAFLDYNRIVLVDETLKRYYL